MPTARVVWHAIEPVGRLATRGAARPGLNCRGSLSLAPATVGFGRTSWPDTMARLLPDGCYPSTRVPGCFSAPASRPFVQATQHGPFSAKSPRNRSVNHGKRARTCCLGPRLTRGVHSRNVTRCGNREECSRTANDTNKIKGNTMKGEKISGRRAAAPKRTAPRPTDQPGSTVHPARVPTTSSMPSSK